MVEDLNKEMLKRLDAIIFLLLDIRDQDRKMSVKDKVKLLNDVGFSYSQIAKVLGKTPGNIAVQLNILKKEEKIKETTISKEESSQEVNKEEIIENGSQ